MSTDSITIPPETARHVLWHYGAAGGYQPGSFTQNLMRTIDSADRTHTEILRTATQPHCDDCGDTDGPFAERVEGLVCEGCIKKRAL